MGPLSLSKSLLLYVVFDVSSKELIRTKIKELSSWLQ